MSILKGCRCHIWVRPKHRRSACRSDGIHLSFVKKAIRNRERRGERTQPTETASLNSIQPCSINLRTFYSVSLSAHRVHRYAGGFMQAAIFYISSKIWYHTVSLLCLEFALISLYISIVEYRSNASRKV